MTEISVYLSLTSTHEVEYMCNSTFLNSTEQPKLVQFTEAQLEAFISLLTDEKCETSSIIIPFRAEEHARQVHPNYAVVENMIVERSRTTFHRSLVTSFRKKPMLDAKRIGPS